MSRAQPTAQQERWLVLAARHPALRAAAETDARTGGWKSSTWLSRCLFFVLGLFGASMTGGTLLALPSEARLLAGAIAGIALAEYLIGKRRVVRSGIEEALYVCGSSAFAIQLALWADAGAVVGALLLAAALGLTGMRLLNPLFTTLAALVLSIAVALLGQDLDQWQARVGLGCAFCCALALTALALAAKDFARPTHDRMLDGLIVTMPLAASLWLLVDDVRLAFVVPLALGLVCLAAGVRRRSHAALLAAVLQWPCLAWSLHGALPLAKHWQLILWGTVTLLLALTVERRLRHSSGIVTRSLGEDGATLEILQTVGAAAASSATPGVQGNATPATTGQGGAFGGGGASGQF